MVTVPPVSLSGGRGFLFFEIKMRNIGSLYILGMTSNGAGNIFRISKK
jgi:hypothetical protein